MFFKYNGDKTIMSAYGYDFSDYKTVEINDSFVMGKLKGNSHFDVVDEDGEAIRIFESAEVTTDAEEVVIIDAEENDINCDYGVFRIKSDGQNYSQPDAVFETMEECNAYMEEKGFAPESRIILKREKADV